MKEKITNNKEKVLLPIDQAHGGKTKEMRKKLNKDVIKIGETIVNINNLTAIDAISITLVGILSVTIGTIYGLKML